jgi:hypothetical protein
VFDGWRDAFNHFVGLYACFPDPFDETKAKTYLLAFAPLLDEQDLSSESYCDFVESTLEVYEKDWSAVVFVVGDNCSTNRKISRLIEKPMIGCASHWFNLAVKAYI